MLDIFYTVFIFPVEQAISLSYVFAYRILRDPALSVLAVSFAVSILTLPLYFMAEKHQKSERAIQERMRADVMNIKAVFSGNERFMRLSVYYRQNGYHPLHSLRSSISLFIQVPFFIAAWRFLSNLQMIQGVPLGPIANLAEADSLLTLGNISVNILPVVMTLISILSAAVYTKGLPAKEKIQLYGMAAVFLVLLYNSPAGLVIYWMGNNFFSLVKNLVQRAKQPYRVVLAAVSFFCILLSVFLLFFHDGNILRRLAVIGFTALAPLALFLSKIAPGGGATFFRLSSPGKTGINAAILPLSLVILFLLAGLVIPSSLIASSVQQFSFLGNYESPFPFLFNTALQAFGIFMVWPLCMYLMFKKSGKMALGAAALAVTALVSVFFFPGDYGALSITFRFSQEPAYGAGAILLNLFALAFIAVLTIIIARRWGKVMAAGMTIAACALALTFALNSIRINSEFLSFRQQLARGESAVRLDEPVYRLSKTGRNVLIIMLDTAISGLVPYIFSEKPELYDSFDGFVWYKNTISFSAHTFMGAPGIFGGYEYTPLEMNLRYNVPLVKKYNEALLMLPKIFSQQGFDVTVTDPPFTNFRWIGDLRIFDDFPQIRAENLLGVQSPRLVHYKPMFPVSFSDLTKLYLIRFSFFRLSPVLLRNAIYAQGNWRIADDKNRSGDSMTIDSYFALYALSNLTLIDENPVSTLNIINNNLPHQPLFLQAPGYTMSANITYKGSGPFADNGYYHTNMASFILLGRFFDFMRKNNVFDNTRIIIVSDHGGRGRNVNLPGDFIVYGDRVLSEFAALLMVKDFYSRGVLSVNNTFMTNADVPLIALEGIVDEPVNPWTGRRLESEKNDGVIITTSGSWHIRDYTSYQFRILPNEWLHVHSDIHNPHNWSQVRIP